jgi:hypothetical protein
MNLTEWSQDVVEAAQRNVGAFRTVNGKRRRIDSSGRLRNSLGYLVDSDTNGTVIKFTSDVEYAIYVESGVRGAESSPIGTEDSPFRFGSKQPPIEPILGWMKVKPLRLRDPITGRFVPAFKTITRGKNKGKKRDLRPGVAFGIARNIRRHGIEATHFMTEAIEERLDGLEDVFAEEIEIRLFERLT